jgi:hypothetical protein
MNTITEFKATKINGYLAFLFFAIMLALNAYTIFFMAENRALGYL